MALGPERLEYGLRVKRILPWVKDDKICGMEQQILCFEKDQREFQGQRYVLDLWISLWRSRLPWGMTDRTGRATAKANAGIRMRFAQGVGFGVRLARLRGSILSMARRIWAGVKAVKPKTSPGSVSPAA